MKRTLRIAVAVAIVLSLNACATKVKTFPREVTSKEKRQVNFAHDFDTFGAHLISALDAPPGYDLNRQKVKVDYQYYLDPKLQADPRSFYPRPAAPPEVTLLEKVMDTPEVEVRFIKWDSQYQPRNPAFAPLYATYVEDHTAFGIYVRAKKGNRAAMVISHGWTGGDIHSTWKAERMLDYAALGYDTILVQQPYHGPRAPQDSKFSGEYFLSGEVSRLNEALCQTVTDVRSMVMWLREKYPVVGIKGGSLGGITTLQTAAVEDKIDFAIAWVPPSSLGDIPEDTPLAPFVVKGMRASGLDRDMVKKILFVSSPANFQPMIPKENVLIFAGMGDNFVPPSQPERVWAAWGQPEIVWFAGGHVLNFQLQQCREKEREFMIARLPQ